MAWRRRGGCRPSPCTTPAPAWRWSRGVVHDVGRMVGETRLALHEAAADGPGDAGRGQLVVDPPAHVVGAGRAAVAPPGVFDRIGFRDPEAVLPAALR